MKYIYIYVLTQRRKKEKEKALKGRVIWQMAYLSKYNWNRLMLIENNTFLEIENNSMFMPIKRNWEMIQPQNLSYKLFFIT